MASVHNAATSTQQSVRIHPEQPMPSNMLALSNAPPPAPKNFHGRDEYVNKAAELISTAAPTDPVRLAILGSGGIGKTSVALAILNHPQITQKLRYFVPCDAFTSASMLVAGILRVFGMHNYPKEDPLQVLQNSVIRAAPMLLILDNFETTWDSSESQTAVRGVLQRLDIPTVTLIITMRGTSSPMGIQWNPHPLFLPLGKLSLDAASKAFVGANPQAASAESDEDIKALLNILGDILLMKGQYADATEKLERAHAQFVRIGDIMGPSQCLQSLGDILLMKGRYQDATEKLEQAHAQFAHIGDLRGAAQCLQGLGNILYMQDQYQDATEKLDQAHAQFVSIDDTKGAALCLWRLGNILYMQGQYQDATEKLEQTHAQFVRIDDLLGAALCLQDLGETLRMQGQYADATEKLEQAHAQSVSIANLKGAAQCLQSLGDILSMQDQYQDATEKLEQAHAQFVSIGDLRGASQCLRSLGNILYMQDQYQDATDKLEQAHAQFVCIGLSLGAAQCLWSLGDILRMQGQYADATEKLEQAHAQFVNIHNIMGTAMCLWRLGVIQKAERHIPEARKLLLSAKDIFSNLGVTAGVSCCDTALSTLTEVAEVATDTPEVRITFESPMDEASNTPQPAETSSAINVARIRKRDILKHKFKSIFRK
ncbi:hypothetical protein PLICRDRAFT_177783 [Plicaturopsis crispa FD-325 SS-3]|nr:hypothetical protein PLICRDRAFT_177783 [Plicaturopsis crispa FD-325 SS-3]